jgi:hypothetical protein
MESITAPAPDSGAQLIEHDNHLALALPLFGRWYLLCPLSPGSRGRSLLCRGHGAIELSGSLLASAEKELATDAGVDTDTSAAWVMRAGVDADDLLAWLRSRIHIDL